VLFIAMESLPQVVNKGSSAMGVRSIFVWCEKVTQTANLNIVDVVT